jgi:hypothetical protein
MMIAWLMALLHSGVVGSGFSLPGQYPSWRNNSHDIRFRSLKNGASGIGATGQQSQTGLWILHRRCNLCSFSLEDIRDGKRTRTGKEQARLITTSLAGGTRP